ncbi:unnamed protein product, partial [Effrenium voratum]
MAFAAYVAREKEKRKSGQGAKGWAELLAIELTGWGAESRTQREHRGFPATLAWALAQLPSPPASFPRVEVWILGARTGMEGWLAEEGAWDWLLEAFPSLRWKLRLIGPEMREGDLTRSPEVEVQGLRLQGHEFTQQSPDRPDLAVCFNSGVGTLALTIASPWLPTLAALLKLDVPLLFTSFGPQERKGEDFILKQLFQAQVLVDVLENPFRQMPEDRPGCYSTLEEDLSGDGEHLCNAQIWWARGSQLPAKELDQ